MKKNINKKYWILCFSLIIVFAFYTIFFHFNKDVSGKSKTISISFSQMIPDLNFRKCILDNYNVDDYSKMKSLSCEGYSIESVEGLEYFKELSYLDLCNNKIKSINLSGLSKLKYLALDDNLLSSIDISNNILLEELNIGYNNIVNINLSSNVNLVNLNATFNNINNIDLSKNLKLSFIDLSMNKLGTIDLSKNLELTQLYLTNNKFNSIDTSKNLRLKTLNILEGNNISKGKILVGKNKYLKIT